MEGKHGKAIVITNFAGIYKAQIVDFDKGGVAEKISMSFINPKQVYQIAVDWHYQYGYPIYEQGLTSKNNHHGNSNHFHGMPPQPDAQGGELQPDHSEPAQANG